MNKKMEFLIYNTPEGNVAINAVIKNETIWLTQKLMAELFDCTTDNISLHLRNIYKEGELSKFATSEEFSVVQQEGSRNVTRKIAFYNLDAIISVGYRVNSRRATQFRIWATKILREYMIKGFVLDDCLLEKSTIRKFQIVQTRDNMQVVDRFYESDFDRFILENGGEVDE